MLNMELKPLLTRTGEVDQQQQQCSHLYILHKFGGLMIIKIHTYLEARNPWKLLYVSALKKLQLEGKLTGSSYMTCASEVFR